jgi:hypothetical protein
MLKAVAARRSSGGDRGQTGLFPSSRRSFNLMKPSDVVDFERRFAPESGTPLSLRLYGH